MSDEPETPPVPPTDDPTQSGGNGPAPTPTPKPKQK